MFEHLYLDHLPESAKAITDMVVRGAPAIGVTAAYAVVLAARDRYKENPGGWQKVIQPDLELLSKARPMAVNLRWAVGQMRGIIYSGITGDPVPRLLVEAQRIHADDIAANRRMGELGAALIAAGSGVLTHCNTGALATGGYGTPDYTVDVLNALASVKRLPEVDPNRFGMWGHSMGGMATLRAMVTSKDIKAGVIWSGVVASYPDLMTKWHHPDLNRSTPTPNPEFEAEGRRRWRNDLIQQYGTPDENPDFWNSISPISFVGDISGPLQLHHSTTDLEVPYEFSQSLDQAMQTAGKTVEFYTYQGDDHNLSQSFGLAMQRSIEFFDKYVKGTG